MGYIAIDADSLNSLVYAGMRQNSPVKYLDALLACTRSSGEILVFTDQIIDETTKAVQHRKDNLLDNWLVHPGNQQETLRPETETWRKVQRKEPVKNPGEESIMDFESGVGKQITVISDDKRFWRDKNVIWHSTQGILATLVRAGYIAKEDAIAAVKHLQGNGRTKTISPYDALDILADQAAPWCRSRRNRAKV